MADAELLRQAERLFDQLFRELTWAWVVTAGRLLSGSDDDPNSDEQFLKMSMKELARTLIRVDSCLDQTNAVCRELLPNILEEEVVSIAGIKGATYIECALEWVEKYRGFLGLIRDELIDRQDEEQLAAEWDTSPLTVLNDCAAHVALELRRELQRRGELSTTQEQLPQTPNTIEQPADNFPVDLTGDPIERTHEAANSIMLALWDLQSQIRELSDENAILDLAEESWEEWDYLTQRIGYWLEGVEDVFAQAALFDGRRVEVTNWCGSSYLASSLHDAAYEVAKYVRHSLQLAADDGISDRAIREVGGDPNKGAGLHAKAVGLKTALGSISCEDARMTTLRREKAVAAMLAVGDEATEIADPMTGQPDNRPDNSKKQRKKLLPDNPDVVACANFIRSTWKEGDTRIGKVRQWLSQNQGDPSRAEGIDKQLKRYREALKLPC